MKGAEIIERFRKAENWVAQRAGHLGEIGDFLRHHGYLVDWNGFSVCDFGEQDVKLRYSADCCGRPWQIRSRIAYGNADELLVSQIDPAADYDVPMFLSMSERLEKGLIDPKEFGVFEITNRTRKLGGKASTIDKADEIAKRLCQDTINRYRNDRDLRRYTESEAKNNSFLAKEQGVFKYYRAYYYDGYYVTFVVEDIKEK